MMSLKIGKAFETFSAAVRAGIISVNEVRAAMGLQAFEEAEENIVPPLARPLPAPPARIEYVLTWNELDALRGGDPDLVPILRAKGMDVEMGVDTYGRSNVVARTGTFRWVNDNSQGGRRIFIWEGANPVNGTPASPTIPIRSPQAQVASSAYVLVTNSTPRSNINDYHAIEWPIGITRDQTFIGEPSVPAPTPGSDEEKINQQLMKEFLDTSRDYDEPDAIGGRKITFDE